MKSVFKHIALATALVSMGAANAAAVTVVAGSGTTVGTVGLDLYGSGTLSFSPVLISALNAGGVQVAAVAPATVAASQNARFKYLSVSAAAPVTALSGDLTDGVFTIDTVATAGGALQTAEDDGLTNTGGTLSITNLTVDLGAKRVYADLEGANGVGLKSNVHLWNYANITGSSSISMVPGVLGTTNELSGLSITSGAFGYFTQSLGLLEDGVSALSKVTDFGTINATIFLTVPEPSTYALIGTGLLVLSIAARRRRARRTIEQAQIIRLSME